MATAKIGSAAVTSATVATAVLCLGETRRNKSCRTDEKQHAAE